MRCEFATLRGGGGKLASGRRPGTLCGTGRPSERDCHFATFSAGPQSRLQAELRTAAILRRPLMPSPPPAGLNVSEVGGVAHSRLPRRPAGVLSTVAAVLILF